MPSPMRTSHAADELAKRRKQRPLRWIIPIAVGLIIVIAGVFLFLKRQKSPEETGAPEAVPIRSIAVLPFIDMSQEKDQEWFCDGMADAILNALTHVGELKVPARTSAFAFKGTQAGIPEIGERLGVESVLEGSVIKSGTRMTITAQLIAVDDGFHIWSETYERDTGDAYPLIREISLAIVDALRISLLEEEKAAVEKQYTDDPRAYELYLLSRNSKGITLERKLEYLEEAVERDPDFAPAYVEICQTYWSMGSYQIMTWEEASTRAMEALDTALALDDALAEAHVTLARMKDANWEWEAAEREFRRALELNPGSAEVHRHYAGYLRYHERGEEALKEIETALELNPLYISSYVEAIAINIVLERYDAALEAFGKGTAIDPGNGYLYQHLGRLYRRQGRYGEAIEAFRKQYELSGRKGPNFNLGLTYAFAGEREKAETVLGEVVKLYEKNMAIPQYIALFHIAFGDHDTAFEWLERAYADSLLSSMIISDYEYDPIRGDPRYRELLKKMGLPTE